MQLSSSLVLFPLSKSYITLIGSPFSEFFRQFPSRTTSLTSGAQSAPEDSLIPEKKGKLME